MGVIVNITDIIPTLTTNAWELALLAAVVHHFSMKVPQRHDTALAIWQSAFFANLICAGLVVFMAKPRVLEWVKFNFAFVRLISVLLMYIVYDCHKSGNYPKCILQA